jgi:hypothetical protein
MFDFDYMIVWRLRRGGDVAATWTEGTGENL